MVGVEERTKLCDLVLLGGGAEAEGGDEHLHGDKACTARGSRLRQIQQRGRVSGMLLPKLQVFGHLVQQRLAGGEHDDP